MILSSKGTATGQATITNLPFIAFQGGYTLDMVLVSNITIPSVTYFTSSIESGTNVLKLIYLSNTAGTGFVTVCF